jgi:hypothetical protein
MGNDMTFVIVIWETCFYFHFPLLCTIPASPALRKALERAFFVLPGGYELQGHQVTAFVRDPARLPVKNEKLRVVTGNILDLGRVGEALACRKEKYAALMWPTSCYSSSTTIAASGRRCLSHE